MGQVASQLADFSIVTSDNPRNEDPQSIINQITVGFQNNNYQVLVNRKEEITKALGMAQKDDIVLIAGKGHEMVQILSDRKIDFNEREIIEKCLSC